MKLTEMFLFAATCMIAACCTNPENNDTNQDEEFEKEKENLDAK